MKWICGVIVFLAVSALMAVGQAPKKKHNYDESKVPPYTLPDPLVCFNGEPARSVKAWREIRRPEILAAFETNVYGRVPQFETQMKCVTRESDAQALGGIATRRQIEIQLFDDEDAPKILLLMYIPNDAPKPVPAFLGLSYGNQGVSDDPAIIPSPDTVSTNAQQAHRWPLEMILKRGYAVATFAGADLEIDRHGSGSDPKKRARGWQLGIRGYVARKAGREAPADDEWGAIAAWAWGMSRVMDFFEADKDIDAKKVAVFGHSRTGKTALWAGAKDERFAITISNNSGAGGAALARRWFGETVDILPDVWFAKNYKRFADHEDRMPVDQHLLVALVAPRPVYIASATLDQWADPRGEFLAAFHATPVFKLHGLKGVGASDMPLPNSPVGDSVRYHIRKGRHNITPFDWEHYLSFADRHLGQINSEDN